MATRAERMQQRIRGAGHGQVEDVSFHLDLGGGDTTSEASPESNAKTPQPTRTTPNMSAKRRRLDTDPDPPSQRSGPPTATRAPTAPETTPPPASSSPSHRATTAPDQETDDLALLPPAHHATPGSARSAVSRRSAIVEEVGESPAKAPGTGQRRRVSGITSSSQKLQEVIDAADAEGDVDPLSSPSEQRTKRSRLSASRASEATAKRPSPLAAQAENADELSPEQTARSRRSRSQASPELTSRDEPLEDEASTQHAEETAEPESQLEKEPGPESSPEEQIEEQVEEQAEEISPTEAARRMGRKRPRRSPRRSPQEPSPNAVDESVEEPAEVEQEEEPPAPKRQRKQTKTKTSPAKQKQGNPKPKPKKNTKAATKSLRGSASENNITINSQRFTKRRRAAESEDADSHDILNADIPYAKRTGVNCVDVLSTVCGDIIEAALEALGKSSGRAHDAAARQEIRTKTKALEAYKRELEYRFLTHTISVDHMHSLRQRVKSEQEQTTALREDIMRLRSEREHVAVRKDAVRVKHEKEREESLHQLGLSSAMHDIELAIDRGRAAPELSAPEEKKAGLANIELMVSNVANQSCTASDAGGTLKQLKDFNAFLERAAMALESR